MMMVNLYDLNAPTLGLQELKLRHIVDRADVEKGSHVNFDFTKNADKTIVKDGKMGDVHDLHIKSGKGTGLEEIQNIQGITRDNLKDAHKVLTPGNEKSTGAEKKKAADDVWFLADKKIAAMDNIDWDKKFADLGALNVLLLV